MTNLSCRRPHGSRCAAMPLLLVALRPYLLSAVAAGMAVQAVATGQTAPAVAPAQPAPPGLSLEQIMADPDWIGNPPEDPYWAGDGRAVYFERKRQGSPLRDLYRLRLDEREPRLVPDAERAGAGAPGGAISRDRRWMAYARDGDIFL
ncbi:MAG TPA: hypothetical protein VOA80_23420, partial [Thermoanaerobaculia bacterium]|nr:hypothetical protein [Thermoanaerobaculia bacterium]